jgi:hypothetical protein
MPRPSGDVERTEGARSIVILSAAKDLSILRCGGELHRSFAAKDAAQDDNASIVAESSPRRAFCHTGL